MTEITIRKAISDDAQPLIALQRSLFAQDPNSIEPQEFIGGSIARATTLVVAERGGEIVGFTALRDRGIRPWSGMDFIGVMETARGQGVADRLLKASCALCPRPFLRLFVRPSNAVARKLYARHGFRKTGTRAGNYPDGEDALILMRWTGLGSAKPDELRA